MSAEAEIAQATDPGWLYVGAQALHRDTVSLHAIARMTKRDVVLDNGSRYGRENLRQRGASLWDNAYLDATTAPRVLDLLAKQRRDRAEYAAGKVLRQWRDTGDAEHAERAIAVIRAALGVEKER